MKKLLKILKTSLPFGIILLISTSVSAQDNGDSFPWKTFESTVESNSENPQKIMLFMEADWCAVCKRMKREVFPDQTIQTLINNHFYPVRIDIESKEMIPFGDELITKMELSKQFGIRGTPTIIFLNSDFSVIGNKVGFSDTEEFANLLKFIKDEEYHHSSFEEYLQDIQ